MQTTDRDPYATQPPPKSKSGAMLRYVIVAALLAAAGVGYATMGSGPGLTDAPPDQATAEQTTKWADASQGANEPALESAPAPTTAVPPAAPLPPEA